MTEGFWRSHVEESFEAAHHNAPPDQPDHKCARVHGHSWRAEVEMVYSRLDGIGWGPDFGQIKAIIRSLDHNDLNELLAPLAPSAEHIAQWLYREIEEVIGLAPALVRIHEGRGNSVEYRESR